MSVKVAVVTGANKGIGYAIVKGLCENFQGTVYLTSRDITRGQNAVAELKKEGYSPSYHQLDITDRSSIEKFRDHLKEKNNGIYLLINNAAIAFKRDATDSFTVQADETTKVNYFSLVSVCDLLFPLIRNGGRVVNISSSAGMLHRIPGKEVRDKFSGNSLTKDELSSLITQFVNATKNGTHEAEGWPNSAYAVSKCAVTALTFIQQKELAARDIKVNCVHPGYVNTDMTSHKGTLTIEQGASAPLYLALDAPDDVRGVYMWKNKTIVEWTGPRPSE